MFALLASPLGEDTRSPPLHFLSCSSCCCSTDTSSQRRGWEPTASWAMVVDRRMVIACWCSWMVDVRRLQPTCAAAWHGARHNRCQQQTAAAELHSIPPCNTKTSQFCQLCLLHPPYYITPHYHGSCGDIFSQFNPMKLICKYVDRIHPSLEFTTYKQNGIFHNEIAASNGDIIRT